MIGKLMAASARDLEERRPCPGTNCFIHVSSVKLVFFFSIGLLGFLGLLLAVAAVAGLTGYAIKCNRVVEVEKVEETTNILAYFLGALALIFFVTSGYLLVDNKNLKQSFNQLRSSSK